MPRNSERKYRQVIDYVEDEVGVDIPRDVKKMAIEQVDDPLASDGLPIDIDKIGGTDQSGADLLAVLESITGSQDEIRVSLRTDNLGLLKTNDQPLDVSDTEVDVDLNSQSLSPITITDDGSFIIDAANQDTLTTDIEGTDKDGNTATVQAEDLTTALNGNEVGIITYLARALTEVGGTTLQTNLQDTGITQPADIQDSLEKSDETYGADIETNNTTTLQVDGYSTVEVLVAGASQSTDITVRKSWDNSNFFDIETDTGVTEFNNKYSDVTAKYIQVEVTGTGTAGDTADIVVGSTL